MKTRFGGGKLLFRRSARSRGALWPSFALACIDDPRFLAYSLPQHALEGDGPSHCQVVSFREVQFDGDVAANVPSADWGVRFMFRELQAHHIL